MHGPGPYAVVDGRVRSDGVEVVVCHHCNLRCRSCAYLAPTLPAVFADPDQLHRDLSQLARTYHATEARVLGGEPLLHPDLPAVVEAVRGSGICDTIRLITNGVRLQQAASRLWHVIDEVSISAYPGHEPSAEMIHDLERTAARHDVQLKVKRFTYFRESYSEVGTNDAELVERIFRSCQMANVWRCTTVWQGGVYRCPQSLFLPTSVAGLAGVQEGIAISDDPSFLSRLLAFLEAPDPLPSCRNCLGSVGRLFVNQQVRRSTWRDPQSVPTEELVDRAHLLDLEANPDKLVRDTSYIPAQAEL